MTIPPTAISKSLESPLTEKAFSPADDTFIGRINQHKKILFKVAYTYCANVEDRRDLVQDMILQLWQSFDTYQGNAQFSSWMYRVAVNVAISKVRHEVRRLRDGRDTVSMDFAEFDLLSANQVFDVESDNMRTLRKLIDQLDEINRALILLYLDGFAADEISEILGISSTNVTTRINRLRQKLQAQFTSE